MGFSMIFPYEPYKGFNPLKGVSSHPSFLGRPSQFCPDHPNTRAGPAAAWVKALDDLLEVRCATGSVHWMRWKLRG